MKKNQKLHIIFGSVLISVFSCCIISCNSLTYYKLDEQPKDYSLKINADSVIREGKLFINQEVFREIQLDSDDINIFGSLSTRDNKPQKPFFKDFYKDYEFPAIVQSRQKINEIKILFRVYSTSENGIDLDSRKTKYIHYFDIDNSFIQFKYSKIPDFTVQHIPCRVGSFIVGSDEYNIDAMLEDVWIPVYLITKKRNPAYEIRNLSERASRVMRMAQKYTIRDTKGIVVGSIQNGIYQLYDTVDRTQIDSIIQSIAVLHISCSSTDVLLNAKLWY